MDWRCDMDRAYANGDFIADAGSFVPGWAARASAFRATAQARLDLPYGPSEAEALDLFLPDGPPRGLLVFVHGGYWMAFGRKDWSHLAAGAVARGWACAVPSYGLAPGTRIAAMTGQVAAAIRRAAALVPGPVVVCGHSAGGQLAARMACADPALAAAADLWPRIVRVVPISPLADLLPLMQTRMNQTLHLDAAECAAESPARHPLRVGCAAHVWVGGQERPSFLWQARLLSEEWACPWTVDPGLHHFNVIDGLAVPGSALMAACLDGL